MKYVNMTTYIIATNLEDQLDDMKYVHFTTSIIATNPEYQ